MIPALGVVVLLVVVGVWREVSWARRADAVLKEQSDLRIAMDLLHVANRTHGDKMFTAYREDMQVMAQRIQAPELAVVEHQQANVQDPDSFPLTDQQLAEQQELAAFVEQVERVENENLGILS